MNQSDRTTEPRTLLSEQILQSARERAARLQRVWEMTAEQRVMAMRRGELSLEQCAAWAARYPEQVPVLNGEFEYLAAFTPEARE
ncbi:MAG TPA: hypothetical protein VNY27_09450 [Solirubrobacteraceae bacterium]|jgi:hypothetical protein|nr:hypothetical protein [Solirubrobacteraceae bacterium]